MKLSTIFSILLIISVNGLHAQIVSQSYHQQNDFLLTSPGAMKFGLYGFDNPALLTYLRQPDLSFYWSDAVGKWNDFNRWGFFTAVPNLGFGLIHQKAGDKSVTDYKLSMGFGDKDASFGFASSARVFRSFSSNVK